MADQGNQVRLPAGGKWFLSSQNLDTTQCVQVSLSLRVKWPVREAMYSHSLMLKGRYMELCLHIPKRYEARVAIYRTNLSSYTYTGINDTNKGEE